MLGTALVSLRSRIGGLFWGRRLAGGGIRTWMCEPIIRRYINESISGSPDCWPIDWLIEILDGRRFPRAVSLGCGEGSLERDLCSKSLCDEILGVDISGEAVHLARAAAARLQLRGLTYRTGDLNSLDLPERAFEAAFFHQSLHHVEHLDRCLSGVARALEPNGLLYLDEYVGPSRSSWGRELLHEASRVFARLPSSVRRSRQLRLPTDWRDPTEAIASEDILPAVARHFTVRQRRDYGGNLLSVLYPHLRLDHLAATDRDALLQHLIEQERQHVAATGTSYYTVVLAEPLRGAGS